MMDSQVNTFPRFERAGFASMATIAGGVLFLIGAAPRTERALFLKDVGGVPAKAFSAVVPPLDAARAQVERSLITYGPGARGLRPVGTPITGRRPPQFIALNQPLVPGAFGTPLTAGGGGGQPDEQTPSSGLLPTPTGGQGAGIGSDAGPGGPTTGGSAPTTPGGGAPTAAGLPGPIAGAPAIDTPASALPEPATWTMMLLGFLAIGVSVRSRPRGRPRRSRDPLSGTTAA